MVVSVYLQGPAALPLENDPTGGLMVPIAGPDALQQIKHFKINN